MLPNGQPQVNLHPQRTEIRSVMEDQMLNSLPLIDAWFDEQWQKTPAVMTSSVDLRYAGYKCVPVDTNLFPAGFNNLNPAFLSNARAVMASVIQDKKKILILPESHTRNQFYRQSLCVLKHILSDLGCEVRLGSLDETLTSADTLELADGDVLCIEPLCREKNALCLPDFIPDLCLLNNDLSSGVPKILQGLDHDLQPSIRLGWTHRLKSTHFDFYSQVVDELSQCLQMDAWFIKPLFTSMDGIDFMNKTGLEHLATVVDELLAKIRVYYKQYDIPHTPFVVVKADNGTYGMSVMMVHEGREILSMNRKQRVTMAATKGRQVVGRVMIQEGVHSIDTIQNGAVAEPVIYLLGSQVVGGFYRVHASRGYNENLNAPGMYFEPFAVHTASAASSAAPNRADLYGVIARLAALAAARECASLGETR